MPVVSSQQWPNGYKGTYLSLCFPFPLWISFANQVKIFFIKLLLFFTLDATPLLLLPAFALGVIRLFLLVLIDDEAFSNLRASIVRIDL